MEQGAAKILKTLDRHLDAPCRIRLLGGAALILGYGMARSTEDADLLLDDAEAQFLAEERNFSEALEKTNAELESEGLYISHLWGPEQQILTPDWRSGCRRIALPGMARLEVECLGPLDLITSKLCRADAGDLADIEHLVRVEALTASRVRAAIDSARVPGEFADVFAAHREKVLSFLARGPR